MAKNNERFANFELCRIFAMFLIVLSHYNVHGIYPYWHKNESVLDYFNNLISLFLSTGNIGVTLFILMTGYFSCQQNFKLKKWLDIYLKTLFYSILIFLGCFYVDSNQAIKAGLYSIFPLTHSAYWFVTTYLFLYAFSPALNIILEKTSSEMVRNYLILGLILWIILPLFGSSEEYLYSRLIYFMYLYLLGGAIKLKHLTIPSKYLLVAFLYILIFMIALIMCNLILWGNQISLWVFYNYLKLNTIYTFLISLGIFYFFKNLKINCSLINWLATSMFGVYLLHDNNLIRPYLWHTFLNVEVTMNSPYFVVWVLIISSSVFGICIILDKLLSLFYTPFINYIGSKLAKIDFLKRYF